MNLIIEINNFNLINSFNLIISDLAQNSEHLLNRLRLRHIQLSKEFDLTNNTWSGPISTTNTAPSARGSHSSVVYNGKMIIFGGYENDPKKIIYKRLIASFLYALFFIK